MGRVENEALNAITLALSGQKYSGEFVSSRTSGEDISIYCIVTGKNDKLIDKVLAIVWTETQAGILSAYVDINPGDDYDHMEVARKVVEDYLATSGFKMELEVKEVWYSWRKTISSVVRKNG